MKILLINVVYNQGSTGKIMHDLYRGYQTAGHEVRVCYGRGPVRDDPNIFKTTKTHEFYIDALLTRVTGLVGYGCKSATRRLLRYIDNFNPDIIHLHNIHGYYINVNMLLSYLKQSKIKTVFTLHDEWSYTGKCGHSYECDGWKNSCGNCPEKQNYPKSILFDRTAKMLADKTKLYYNFDSLKIVSVSKWLDSRVEQSILGDKQRYVVHNGINTNIFHPEKSDDLRKSIAPNGEKVVVHVTANFSDPLKGGKYMLELAKLMPDVKFVIVGNKEPIINLPSNVIAVGRTENQTELAKYYSMADVSLITSERENFPTVCIESICCGTPVIGFMGGGTAETAPDNYGKFVPFGDMSALESVARLALGGQLEAKLNCSRYGLASYDSKIMVEKYLELMH